jgi:hypothetical protein
MDTLVCQDPTTRSCNTNSLFGNGSSNQYHSKESPNSSDGVIKAWEGKSMQEGAKIQ